MIKNEMSNELRKKLEKEIINWNNRFPLDYWWRKKYGIPFGSQAHEEMSFLDMYREYLEDKLFANKNNPEPNYENIDEEFDNLDIDKY